MTKDEALKVALGTLKKVCVMLDNQYNVLPNGEAHEDVSATITAIKEALEGQPEQEPDAPDIVVVDDSNSQTNTMSWAINLPLPIGTPLYTSPPVQKQEPVAAQHRFRHPQKTMQDWSAWQPCKIKHGRHAWEFDSQGYEVEYRELYTSPLAKPWVNPSIKEYEDIMLANIMPRTNDERDGIMSALNDMVVLLQEKNT